MKPAPFDYVRPDSLAQVCELLADDEDARVIAGGQTLVPMLAMRLARPAKLIDILRLPELAGVRRDGAMLVVGATPRQAQAERDPLSSPLPMLARYRLGRASTDPQPRHHRRLDRQCRPFGGNSPGGGDARRGDRAGDPIRSGLDAGG